MVAAADPDRRTRRLRDAGFTYDERPDVWFNVDAHRALGGKAVRANTEEWLATWLAGREQVHAAPSVSRASSPHSRDTRSPSHRA